MFTLSPKKSILQVGRESEFSFNCVQNVLKNVLIWCAWKKHYCQALSAEDCDICAEFAKVMMIGSYFSYVCVSIFIYEFASINICLQTYIYLCVHIYVDMHMCILAAQWSAANCLHGQRTGAFLWRPVLWPFLENQTIPALPLPQLCTWVAV